MSDRTELERKANDYMDAYQSGDYVGAARIGNELFDGWIKLPVDADGMPVRIGDVMMWPEGDTFEVIGVGEDGTLFYCDDNMSPADWTIAGDKHHYHESTVRKPLREMANDLYRHFNGIGDNRRFIEPIIKNYAKRIEETTGADERDS